MHATLARLERALIFDGGSQLHGIAMSAPVHPFAWPPDLPPLPDDARAWLGWRDLGLGYPPVLQLPGDELCLTVSLDQAITATRDLQADCPGMIVVLDGVVCDANASLYKLAGDARQTAVSLGVSLADFIGSIASVYKARRDDPARRLRLAADAHTTWSELPSAAELADAPVGTAVQWGEWLIRRGGGRPRYSVAVRFPDAWRSAPVYSDDSVDALRRNLAVADVHTFDTRGLIAHLEAHDADVAAKTPVAKIGGSRPLPLRRATVRVWTQPRVDDLLARLVASPLPVAFAPGARPEAVAGLPDELRTLYELADGSRTAIYQRYQLASIDDARHTSEVLLELRSQFGDDYWHPSFMPFLVKSTGDNLYVDGDGRHGPPGSVIDFNHERPAERVVLYDSVAQFLECLVGGIECGYYVWDDEAVFPRDWDESPRVHEAVYTNGAYPWTRTLALTDV